MDYWGQDGTIVETIAQADVAELLEPIPVQIVGTFIRSRFSGGHIVGSGQAAGIAFANANDIDYSIMDSQIDNVKIERTVNHPGIDCIIGSNRTVDLTIQGCRIDVDPFMESTGRTQPLDGSWQAGMTDMVGIRMATNGFGWVVKNCEFLNCFKTVVANDANALQLNNTCYCEPVSLDYNV